MKYIKLIFFSVLFILLLSSCLQPEKTKIVIWKNYNLTLEQYNGGATVSNFWKIKVHKRSWLREHLIFESYSFPNIQDIRLKDNILWIITNEDKDQKIVIDLTEINDYIKEPVIYKRGIMQKGTNFYKEPDFIRTDNIIKPTRHK